MDSDVFSLPSQGFKELGSSDFHRMLEGPSFGACDLILKLAQLFKKKKWLADMLVELASLSPEALCSRHRHENRTETLSSHVYTSVGVEAKVHPMSVSVR